MRFLLLRRLHFFIDKNTCKFDTLANIFKKPTDCFIYADDGDTIILEDRYGKPLKEASVQEVVNCLENLPKKDADYRRVKPLLALMKAFAENMTEWESLAVLCYGH